MPVLDEVRDALVRLYRVRDGILRMYRFILGKYGIDRLPTVKFYPDYIVMVTDDRVSYIAAMHYRGIIVLTPHILEANYCFTVLHELYHFIQYVTGTAGRSVSEVEAEADRWAKSIIDKYGDICSKYFNVTDLVTALNVLNQLRLADPKLYDELSSRFSDILFGG